MTIDQLIIGFPLAFVGLIIAFIGTIIGLDVIWRVQKRLRLFATFLVLAIVLRGFGYLVVVVDAVGIVQWAGLLAYVDVVSLALLCISFIELFKIVRSLDGEQPQ